MYEDSKWHQEKLMQTILKATQDESAKVVKGRNWNVSHSRVPRSGRIGAKVAERLRWEGRMKACGQWDIPETKLKKEFRRRQII